MSQLSEKDLLKKAQTKPFFEVAMEYLFGRVPTGNEAQILGEMMTLVIDHGPDSPSAQATITAAQENQDVLRSVEAGVHQINERHGGAIEGCAKILTHDDFNPGEMVRAMVDAGERIPGFGHRIYKEADPRATYLEKRIKDLKLDDTYFLRAREIERELEMYKGKKLVLNIDAAMASVLCALKIKPEVMNAFFLWPRVAGLVYRWQASV